MSRTSSRENMFSTTMYCPLTGRVQRSSGNTADGLGRNENYWICQLFGGTTVIPACNLRTIFFVCIRAHSGLRSLQSEAHVVASISRSYTLLYSFV